MTPELHRIELMASRSWNRPVWVGDLPSHVQNVLEEVYLLVDNGRTTLSVVGLRILIELVARDGAGKAGSMPERLDGLRSQGFISPQQRTWLAGVVSQGNAAAHEACTVSGEALRHLLLCVEHLLLGYFVLRRPAMPSDGGMPMRSG